MPISNAVPKDTRKSFIDFLLKVAEHDKRVMLIIGDVGFRYIESFKDKFPNQFLNAGAAEQNMMGMAAGLSRVGWKPYIYTMINFIVFRPYEQVRNDLAYGNANVKLFGVKGSEAYKFLGHSHNVYPVDNFQMIRELDEDQQLMDHLPNFKTYYPDTDVEAKEFMNFEYQREGPAYFRI